MRALTFARLSLPSFLTPRKHLQFHAANGKTVPTAELHYVGSNVPSRSLFTGCTFSEPGGVFSAACHEAAVREKRKFAIYPTELRLRMFIPPFASVMNINLKLISRT